MKMFLICILALGLVSEATSAAWKNVGTIIEVDTDDPALIGDTLVDFKILGYLSSLDLASPKNVTVTRLAAKMVLLEWQDDPNCKAPSSKYVNQEAAIAEFYYGTATDDKYAAEVFTAPADCANNPSLAAKTVKKVRKLKP